METPPRLEDSAGALADRGKSDADATKAGGRAVTSKAQRRRTAALAWLGQRPRFLAWLGLVGVTDFVLAVLALHFAPLGEDLQHMSQFANTRFWLLWVLAVYSFTLGGAALSLAIRLRLSRSLFHSLGVWMLWLAVLGAVLLATFPMDSGQATTLAGTIHGDAAGTTFLLLGLAIMVLVPAFWATPQWRSFARASLVLGVLVTASSIAYLLTTLAGMALSAVAQRVMVAFIATWFILLAVHLLGMPSTVPVAAPPAPAPLQPEHV